MLKPKDIIAFTVIGAFVLLKILKLDSGFESAIMLIIGYYFAKRANGEDKGK